MNPLPGGPAAPSPAPRPTSSARPAWAAGLGSVGIAGLLLAALLPGAFLGGCAPGTSTDAGNPELVIGFRQEGKPVEFGGMVRIYASDSNPVFYAPSPAADTRDVILSVDFDLYGTNTHGWLVHLPVQRLNRHFLDGAAGYLAALPMLPPHQLNHYAGYISAMKGKGGNRLDVRRPFNILIDNDDKTSALVEGVSINAERDGYLADGSPFDTLWVDLKPGVGITGTIDTAGLPDPPLILFMPGTPLSTPVRGNRFHLAGAPRIKFPVRMVTRGGFVYAFREPLDGTRSDAFYADSVLSLVPGERRDSVDLPDILPFPAAPTARPAGPRTFTDTLLVTLSAEAGAAIFYTTNGDEPGLESERYTAPVRLKGSAILKAVAYKQGQNLSPVSANSYDQVPLSPKAAPASLAFRDSVTVTLTTPALDGVILYTVDGSAPTESSPVYARPLVFKATTTLKAVTLVEGLRLSLPVEENYILIPDTLGQP